MSERERERGARGKRVEIKERERKRERMEFCFDLAKLERYYTRIRMLIEIMARIIAHALRDCIMCRG